MSDEEFAALEAAIEADDTDAVIAVFERTTRAQREDWPKRMRAQARAADAEREANPPPPFDWSTYEHPTTWPTWGFDRGLDITAFMSTSNARAAARQIRDGVLHAIWEHAPRIFPAMQVGWLPELLDEAAQLDTSGGFYEWDVVESLRVFLDAPYPHRDGYLLGLIRHIYRVSQLVERLRDESGFRAVFPRILETARIGTRLGELYNDGEVAAEQAIAQSISEGQLDREVILDCVRRALQVGGTPAHVAFFVRLHRLLGATAAETARHSDAYLELLVSAPGSSAAEAHRVLVRAVDADLLDPKLLVEASAALLTRPEKTLLVTHLRWLTKAVETRPELQASVSDAVQVGLEHPRADLRDQVRDLLERCGESPAAVMSSPANSPQAAPVRLSRALPEPITIQDLISATAASIAKCDVPRVEQVVAGVARFGSERRKLHELLVPFETHLRSYRGEPGFRMVTLDDGTEYEYESERDPWRQRPQLALLNGLMDGKVRATLPREASGTVMALVARLQQVGAAAVAGAVVAPIAYPSHDNGSLEPEDLLRRLGEAKALELQTTPLEIEQAWLRLPPAEHSSIVGPLRALGTPDAERMAGLLERGPLDSPTTAVEFKSRQDSYSDSMSYSSQVEVSAPDDGPWSLPGLLWQSTGRWGWEWFTSEGAPFDPLYLAPHHREVAASALTSILTASHDRSYDNHITLVGGLAAGSGPLGVAGHHTMALCAGAPDRRMRTTAVDTIEALVVQAAIDPALFAVAAQNLFTKIRPASRLVEVVAELSRRSVPARRFVVDTVLAWLPELVQTNARETPRLLMAAADAATGLAMPPAPRELQELAGSTSKNRLTTEAKRLAGVLGP